MLADVWSGVEGSGSSSNGGGGVGGAGANPTPIPVGDPLRGYIPTSATIIESPSGIEVSIPDEIGRAHV